MSGFSSIEWTEQVWNPVTGCTKVSAGCKHCYAEAMANRFWKDRPFSQVREHPDRLDWPTSLKAPARIFVNSMSDLFHPAVSFKFTVQVLEVMRGTPQHTYMILTKRLQLARLALLEYYRVINVPVLPNVWLGASVESQAAANERVPELIRTPAALHFVSCEPLLEPVDIDAWLCRIETNSLDWVITGGETGPGARPMYIKWAEDLLEQCISARVPFFFKGWGNWKPVQGHFTNDMVKDEGKAVVKWNENNISVKMSKLDAGRILAGRTWDQIPRL